MYKSSHSILVLFLIALCLGSVLVACISSKGKADSYFPTPVIEEPQYYHTNQTNVLNSFQASNQVQPFSLPMRTEMEPSSLLREAKVFKDLIPSGTHARKSNKSMRPRYITIHSTQNYSTGADAWRHSLAQKNGKLRVTKRKNGNRIGYLSWHYTIDQNVVVQHLPDNEQGEHADFDGPGNNYSLGLEMCENSGNSRSLTMERTAKLVAYLMYRHRIPIENVVPHYHWRREGLSQPHKNCPHFLLDNGRPGKKWANYLAKIQNYYDKITVKRPVYPAFQPNQPNQPSFYPTY